MLLSIDPGLSGTGWAYWCRGELLRAGTVHLTPKQRKGLELLQRAWAIREQLPCTRGHVVIERMWVSPALARNANAMLKTSFLSGVLAGSFETGEMVYPSQWRPKGCKGKEGVHDWVQERLSQISYRRVVAGTPKSRREHMFDAIGIGMWYWDREGVDVF